MNRILNAAGSLLIAIPLVAQSAKPVDMNVKRVADRRSTGSFASLSITVELPKIKSGEVGAWRALISSATDDSGLDLVESEQQEPQFQPYQRMSMSAEDGASEPASLTLELKNPNRKARTVKEVKGVIELFTPAKDPNSTAELPKFMSLAGKPLSHKALKANGVEITLMTPAQLDAERKKLGDAKRKEAQAEGLEGESLDQYINSFLEYVLRFEEADVVARIKDPSKRIHKIDYVDAAGETQHVSMRNDDSGFTVLATWGEKPKPDWRMRVSMKTPKNVARYSFALADVTLP